MATKKVTLTAETELQPDVVLEMLTKRGLIGDKRIVSDKARDAQQQKNKMAYHNTQLLLKHYRTRLRKPIHQLTILIKLKPCKIS